MAYSGMGDSKTILFKTANKYSNSFPGIFAIIIILFILSRV